MELLESREIFSVHPAKILIVPVAPLYKILSEGIWFLYMDVIDRLFVATSQSMNDRREQMCLLGTSQLALIRGPNVH